jgi:ABC-type multidrug transport system fused ATPase/permease subunit
MPGGAAVPTGTLVFFILSIDRFFWPIRDLSEKYNLFQSAMASCERIFSLMDTKDFTSDPADRAGGRSHEGGLPAVVPAGVPKPEFREVIRFEDVWFAYQGEDWVLKGINLEIRRGQHVALVGATGSGKTTITNLLTRFYEIQRGRITIDGVDIREFALSDLRALFAVVLQDVFLFTGDIASNVLLSREMTDEQLWEVCRRVNADRFIANFDDGLSHEVRERGSTFSAGERQLLAFARALAFDPPVLILDEATSNIDTETELLIQDALVNLMRDRTAIVIAHRLSTIQHADQIVVLSHGEIYERGTHRELLARDGLYRKLYELQVHTQRNNRPAFGSLAPVPAGAPLAP